MDMMEEREARTMLAGIEMQSAPDVPGFTEGQCPEPIRDKNVNISNHQICIVKADLGPANPLVPSVMFWLKKSMTWNVSESAAREMLCGNCGYYWKTKFIDDCMKEYPLLTPPEVRPDWVNTNQSGGYCEEWNITCTSSRTCDSWKPGGPITDAMGGNIIEMIEPAEEENGD